MAAITATRQTFNPIPAMLFVLVLLAVAAGAVAVKSSQHAEQKHGTEALAIRQSCDNRGPEQVWRDRGDKNKYFQVCRLPDGRLGVRIIKCSRGIWTEVTSFVPSGTLGDGTSARMHEYLQGKATKFRGSLVEACR
jgi:hypothetical protein